MMWDGVEWEELGLVGMEWPWDEAGGQGEVSWASHMGWVMRLSCVRRPDGIWGGATDEL